MFSSTQTSLGIATEMTELFKLKEVKRREADAKKLQNVHKISNTSTVDIGKKTSITD